MRPERLHRGIFNTQPALIIKKVISSCCGTLPVNASTDLTTWFTISCGSLPKPSRRARWNRSRPYSSFAALKDSYTPSVYWMK